MASLFEPLTLRGVTFRNRIGVSPMCQYSSQDGFANDWHLVHLGSRAVGGAGLILAEASAVVADGRITPFDLGIYKDEHIDMLRRIFAFIEQQGSVPGIQIAHAGRKASTAQPWKGGHPLSVEEGGWSPIYAPSAIPFNDGYQVPQELTSAQIQALVRAFADAAQRAHEAGAKVLELHAAHGYLLHSFLSPLSNQRSDMYGGSFENRIRFLCETTAAVRAVWPDEYPLFVRISATDWADGGWDTEQSIELCRRLNPLGVDLIDCSSGGLVPNAKITAGPGYQTPFAGRIRREASVATAAVGLITEPMQSDQIVRTGEADMVLLARQFLRDPYFPLHAAPTLHVKAQYPVQYERASN
jgi:2,4-dienoyl-CoA reductase-like NADH-dependent reductase (Old Yellow Enzyme family)